MRGQGGQEQGQALAVVGVCGRVQPPLHHGQWVRLNCMAKNNLGCCCCTFACGTSRLWAGWHEACNAPTRRPGHHGLSGPALAVLARQAGLLIVYTMTSSCRCGALPHQMRAHQVGCRRFGSEECAQEVALAAGIDVPSIVDCMGDSEADAPHDLLQATPHSETIH